jgi:hypothetical protein
MYRVLNRLGATLPEYDLTRSLKSPADIMMALIG